jgi:hypothetical protein
MCCSRKETFMSKDKHITIYQLEKILAKDKRFEDAPENVGGMDNETTRYFIHSHSGWVRDEGCHSEYVEFYDHNGKSVEALSQITELLDAFYWWEEDPELTD